MDRTREIYLNDISNDYNVVFNRKSLKLLVTLRRFLRRIKSLLKSLKRYISNHSSHAALLISSLLILFLVVNEANISNEKNLVPESTLEKIALNSSFTRNYNNETKNVGAPIWAQKESIKAILFSAKDLDISHKAALLATVEVESGFNPLAKANTSTACGLFQFIKSTGRAYGLNQSNCIEPSRNSKAGVSHYLDLYNTKIKDQVSELEGIERAFRIFELTYYLHHDGINSQRPSSDVKAVVLKGTHFLIKSYMILKQEESNKKNKNLINQVANKVIAKTKYNFIALIKNYKLTLASLKTRLI